MTSQADLEFGSLSAAPAPQPSGDPSRRLLNLSLFTTGSVLFALDFGCVLVAWPLVLWAADPSFLPHLAAAPRPAQHQLSGDRSAVALRDGPVSPRRHPVDRQVALPRAAGRCHGGGADGADLRGCCRGSTPACSPAPGAATRRSASPWRSSVSRCAPSCARLVLDGLLRRRVLRRHLLVVGAGQRAWDLLRMLSNEGGSLNYDIAFLHHDGLGEIDPRLAADPAGRILRSEEFAVLQAAQAVGADQIVIAPDERRGMNLERLLECKTAGFPVVQYLSFVEKEIRRVDLKRMELGWLLYSDGFQFSAIDRFLKRLFDLVASVLVLAATSPVLLARGAGDPLGGAGAGAVPPGKGDPGRPAFPDPQAPHHAGGCRGGRCGVGRDAGQPHHPGGCVFAPHADRRAAATGQRAARARCRSSGRGPSGRCSSTELARQIPLYNERHMVKAGLTGWAQINYPYGASVDDARSKLSYDLYYVKNFSILFDLVILLQTLRVVLWPSGVR